MEDEVKLCYMCERSLELTEFHAKRKECKECSKGIKLAYRYNISMSEYLELLKKQNGVCEICQRSPEEVGVLAVDHDHRCCPTEKTCGKCVRGLLCDRCNRGLGYFMDSIENLDSARSYVLQWTS